MINRLDYTGPDGVNGSATWAVSTTVQAGYYLYVPIFFELQE